MNPPFRAITFCMLCGMLAMHHFLPISGSAGVLCHALIIFSTKSFLLVIILSLRISFFRAVHFSIGLRSGELSGQSKWVIRLDQWFSTWVPRREVWGFPRLELNKIKNKKTKIIVSSITSQRICHTYKEKKIL